MANSRCSEFCLVLLSQPSIGTSSSSKETCSTIATYFLSTRLPRWPCTCLFHAITFCPRLFDRNLSLLISVWMILLAVSHLVLAFNAPRIFTKIANSLVLSLCHQDGSCDDHCTNVNIITLFRDYLGDSITSIPWDSVNVANISLPNPTGVGSIIPMPAPDESLLAIKYMVIFSLRNALVLLSALKKVLASPSISQGQDIRSDTLPENLKSSYKIPEVEDCLCFSIRSAPPGSLVHLEMCAKFEYLRLSGLNRHSSDLKVFQDADSAN